MSDSRVVMYQGGTIGPQPVRRPDDKRKRTGPYSKTIDKGALGSEIKASSREGRFLRTYEQMLLDHLNGSASVTQRAVIVRACRIALHLELLDEQVFAAGKSLAQHDFTHYCAWSNALTRMLTSLGLEQPTGAQTPRLDDYLKTKIGGPA